MTINEDSLSEGYAIRYKGTGPEDDPNRPHNFAILYNDSYEMILVPLESYKSDKNQDALCVLHPDCGWNLVTRKSVIAYWEPMCTTIKSLKMQIDYDIVTTLGKIPENVFLKIKKNALKSEDMPPRYIDKMNKKIIEKCAEETDIDLGFEKSDDKEAHIRLGDTVVWIKDKSNIKIIKQQYAKKIGISQS